MCSPRTALKTSGWKASKIDIRYETVVLAAIDAAAADLLCDAAGTAIAARQPRRTGLLYADWPRGATRAARPRTLAFVHAAPLAASLLPDADTLVSAPAPPAVLVPAAPEPAPPAPLPPLVGQGL